MNGRRQALVRIAESRQQALDPSERQVDSSGMEREKPRNDSIGRIHGIQASVRAWCEKCRAASREITQQ